MRPSNLEILFSPAEFSALRPDALGDTVCVVFDVLRATTSMTVGLINGATKIHPVKEIAEAVELRRRLPNALLAGERDGVRIMAALTGGVDFDLGNSPREFTRERVEGKEIIMTTTNGTRALHACAGARRILAGAILNLGAMARWITKENPERLLIVCAGTYEEAAYEDTWAAGALSDLVWPTFQNRAVADSAQIAREVFLSAQRKPAKSVLLSRNARRLLSNPDLARDVGFCWQRDSLTDIGEMRDGAVQLMV